MVRLVRIRPVQAEGGTFQQLRLAAKGGGEIFGQPDFVFDEQHAHDAGFSNLIIVAARLNQAEAGWRASKCYSFPKKQTTL
jgi:hypothetical protein